MIKQYMPKDNKVVWDPDYDCRMFKVRKGVMYQTSILKEQEICESSGYKLIKTIDEKTIIDVEVIKEEVVVKKPIKKTSKKSTK